MCVRHTFTSKSTYGFDRRGNWNYDGWVIAGGRRDRCSDLELPQTTRCGEYRERSEVAEEVREVKE